jgi:TRAP-type mannitol/chloroaromatic compound transport system substrate-binding protein
MRFRAWSLAVVALGSMAIGALAFGTGPAGAQRDERVRWKMQSAFGSQLPHIGTSGIRFTKTIETLSDGRFEIKFFEPGALVPPFECFDAVSKGAVDACWTTPGYYTGKYPALAFFTTVPFGPPIGEFLGWKWFGGGNKLRDEIYAKHNLVSFDSFAIAPETSGWFRNEVKSIKELQGLKMRFFGLGAQVMQKLGVSTQLLAGADIYPALERGVIEATEFSMPTMDTKLGFYQVAKFNYFPGWHQQSSVSELMINKDAWDKLPEKYKTLIKVALNDTVIHTYVESDHSQFAAMKEFQDKYGVTIKRWSDEDLAAMEKAWLEVLAEESAKDALFKKVADHYLDYRKKFAVWGKAQHMKATYLGEDK